MSPKIRLRPVASRTKMPPRTRPVKTWAANAVAETSSIAPGGSRKTPPVPPLGGAGEARARSGTTGRSRSSGPSRLGCFLDQALLGAGAVELLVGRDQRHHLQHTPLAAQLARASALDDPEVLHRLVVALPPPLPALVVVVGVVGAERVRHLARVG